MKRHTRPAAGALLSVIAVIALAACGSSSSNSSSSTSSAAASGSGTTSAPAKTGGTVTLLMGGAPQSLDPGMDYTTQGAEALWVTYTGLTTYAHAQGVAGSKLIPGSRDGAADDLQRRQDLHRDAAQGSRLLERRAGQGE